ncbi:hypothetical protein EYF80_066327 [Liparis tanakae]|uniref:Uncharacterized protein n=1 Tax=Liparis tanakae TaxID=230148 RepID=A0A4Z2E498_9TELE|nr:hypothetical protein EYF80_066327 [Liparis tanakae]
MSDWKAVEAAAVGPFDLLWTREHRPETGDRRPETGDMTLAAYLTVISVMSSVGAAKTGGDDDWVYLPNKCEGKRSPGPRTGARPDVTLLSPRLSSVNNNNNRLLIHVNNIL